MNINLAPMAEVAFFYILIIPGILVEIFGFSTKLTGNQAMIKNKS